MKDYELDLSIIIVTYNSKRYLQDCLGSVFAQTTDLDYEVFVVDNNSNDGSQEFIKTEFPSVRLIENSENVGFARANNQAIVQSQGRYVLLLNPDTVVLTKATNKMVGFMDSRPDVSATGCRLLNEDGSLQHSIARYPTLINQMAAGLFLHRLFPRIHLFQEIITSESSYQSDHKVEWVFGAALIVRKDVFTEVGLMDEDYFLFSEEKDWCYRVNKANRDAYFFHGAEIIHYGRGNTTAPDVYVQLLKGKLQFFSKYNSGLKCRIFRILTIWNIFLRFCLWKVVGILRIGNKARTMNKQSLYICALRKYLRISVG